MKAPPRRTQPHRLWTVWLALLVAVFGVVAPVVSHALALAREYAEPQIEICTNEGPRWVQSDDAASTDGTHPSPVTVAPLAHCPFCLHSADRMALLSQPPSHSFPVQEGPWEPSVQQTVFYLRHLAAVPPPRGPPTVF